MNEQLQELAEEIISDELSSGSPPNRITIFLGIVECWGAEPKWEPTFELVGFKSMCFLGDHDLDRIIDWLKRLREECNKVGNTCQEFYDHIMDETK